MKHTWTKLLALLMALMLLVPTFAFATEGVADEGEPEEIVATEASEQVAPEVTEAPEEAKEAEPEEEAEEEAEAEEEDEDEEETTVAIAPVEDEVPVGGEISIGEDDEYEDLVTEETYALFEVGENDVASIGETGYESLVAAVAAASDGDTIKLEQDITIDSQSWIFLSSGSLTIDGNNKTITVNNTTSGYSYGPMLYNNVTLKNATISYSDGCAESYILGIYIYGNGTVTLDNVSINLDYDSNSSAKYRYGVYNAGSGTVNIKNSTINSKYAVSASGSDSTMNITDTEINAWSAVSVIGSDTAKTSNTTVNVSDSVITSTNYFNTDSSNIFSVFHFSGGSRSTDSIINVDGSNITIKANGTPHQALAGNEYVNDSNIVNFKSGKVDFGDNTIFEYNIALNISGGKFSLNPQEGAGILEDENENLNDTTENYVVEGYGSFKNEGDSYYVVRKPIVTFDADGGTPAPANLEVEKGGYAAAPSPAPTKKGYTFGGWQLDGKDFDFDAPIMKDIALKAKWDKDEEPETTPAPTATPAPEEEETEEATATPAPTAEPVKVIPAVKKSSKTTITAVPGETYVLNLNGKTGKKFKSSNKKVATVNKYGVVTIKKAGKTKITMKVGKKKRTVTLKVVDPTVPKIVTLNAAGTIAVKKGDTQTLTVTLPEGTYSGIKWKSSNKKVATVNKYGVVTFKKAGKVTITATATRGKKKAKVKFKVSK